MNTNTSRREYTRDITDSLTLVVQRPNWTSTGLVAQVHYRMKDGDRVTEHGDFGDMTINNLRDREPLIRTLQRITKQDHESTIDQEVAQLFRHVIAEEREHHKPILLKQVVPSPDPLTVDIDGWLLLARHTTILFGDGETAKSLLALHVAGQLSRRGKRVLFCDWELTAEDHRVRLEQLFGPDMPDVHYLRCTAPLAQMVETIRNYVESHGIDYLICDSVAFGCKGPAETSDAALSYFAALNDVGVDGVLLIAHNTKRATKKEAGREKPFGSIFWHNAARGTWLIQPGPKKPNVIEATLHNRKSNLQSRASSMSVKVTFEDGGRITVSFGPATATTTADHIRAVINDHGGSIKSKALFERLGELDIKKDTAKKALDRNKDKFQKVRDTFRLIKPVGTPKGTLSVSSQPPEATEGHP